MKNPRPKEKVVSIGDEYYAGFIIRKGYVIRVVAIQKEIDGFLGSDGTYHYNDCYERYKKWEKEKS